MVLKALETGEQTPLPKNLLSQQVIEDQKPITSPDINTGDLCVKDHTL